MTRATTGTETFLEEIRHREIQALHAAFSRRDWHAAEEAGNQLRDKIDRHLQSMRATPALQPSTPARPVPSDAEENYRLVIMDLHEALGVKWGDDVYAAIKRMKDAARPVPPDLVALSAKSNSGEWFVEHGATDSGLSRIDDGTMHGMFPIHGEAHEIELAAAAVNHVRAELAAQAERGTGEERGHG